MAISVTQTNLKEATSDMPKTRSVYDNYDKLKSVVHYDANNNVEFVLKASNNASGKSGETKKLYQVHVDVVQAPTEVSFNRATLTGRIFKNDGSKINEVGFIYWTGDAEESVMGKLEQGDSITPSILTGNFSKELLNLQENTTYNYRAYVKHENGTNYSKVYQFTTISFTSIFSIAGGPDSGPRPLTVNLSAINAGTDAYTFGWNMTGGPISFQYSVSGITVVNAGRSYEPDVTRYTLNSIVIDLSGAGYDPAVNNFVLVNNVVQPSLSAEYAYNGDTETYGISAVTIPAELSGFSVDTFNITFSAAPVAPVTFSQPNDSPVQLIDVISEDLQLTRGSYGALYNPLFDGEGDTSTTNAEWNNDGWGDFSDIETRSYTSDFAEVLSYNIGNNILGSQLIMRDTSTGIIYKMEFTNWQQGAGFSDGYRGVTYIRTALNVPTQTVTEPASGTGSGNSYIIPREFLVLINSIPQPSIEVVTVYNEITDVYQISAINVPSEIFGFTNSARTVTITTNDPVTNPATATAQGGIQIIGDYDTQTITHTYSSLGPKTAKAYAILGDQVIKEASKNINVQSGGTVNVLAQWSNVLGTYGNDIVGAYDFRNANDGVVQAIVGPDLQLVGNTSIVALEGDASYNKVSLLLHMDGDNGSTDFVDSSQNEVELTSVNGAQISTSVVKYGTGAASFNGTNSYITTPADADYGAFGTQDFTVEWWEYLTGSNFYYPIIHYGALGDTGNFSSKWGIRYESGGSFIRVGILGSTYDFSGLTTTKNVWRHCALVRVNGTLILFRDGILHPTSFNVSNINFTLGTNNGIIGGAFFGGGNGSLNSLNGYIDDLRITKGVARYVANFTPPTEAFEDTVGSNLAVQFTPSPGYASANETISVNYPYTLAFVGKLDVTAIGQSGLICAQATKWNANPTTTIQIFGRSSQGLMPYNGNDNQTMGYIPDGSEWFFVAASFLENNTVRYAIRTPTQARNGQLTGSSNKQSFNGFPTFGTSFNGPGDVDLFGQVRLGMFINRAFSTEQEMNDLFTAITSGPVTDIDLTN
jgi:hypothetical protein